MERKREGESERERGWREEERKEKGGRGNSKEAKRRGQEDEEK